MFCVLDASDTGYGASGPTLLCRQYCRLSSVVGSRESAQQHVVELAALQRAPKKKLCSQRQSELTVGALQRHSDNAGAVHILVNGSNKPQLQLLAVLLLIVFFT